MYQDFINQVKDIIEAEFGLMDDSGTILACSNIKMIGSVSPLIDKIKEKDGQFTSIENQSFYRIRIKNKFEYIAFIHSKDPNNEKYLKLISVNIINIRSSYDEKHNSTSFIENIILDNILPGDITLKAKDLRLPNNVNRVAFLIKTQKLEGIYAHEIVGGLFPSRNKDFVIILDDETTVLVKELKGERQQAEINKNAKNIIDTLLTEGMVRAKVGIGTVVDNISDIARSFKEAQTALLIGGIFENEKNIINYSRLGIGRLIYQLPPTLCELFLEEVFKGGAFEAIDPETMNTVIKFFENNLNISETSRQLYVHRNTLVYRMEKIQKATGLDLRLFDDAIIFKVAILVKRYLDNYKSIT